MATRVTGVRQTDRLGRKAGFLRRSAPRKVPYLRDTTYRRGTACRAPTGLCLLVAGLAITFGSAGPLLADARSQHAHSSKAIIVVLHGVSWEELAAAGVPPLQALLRRAAVGVMNSRVLDSPGWSSPYVTIGAGRGAVGIGWFGLYVLPAGPAARAADADFGLDWLRDANRQAHTQAQPGLLGTLMHQHGLTTGLLMTPSRRLGAHIATPSVAILMDSTALVDQVKYAAAGDARGAVADILSASNLVCVDLSPLLHRPFPAPSPTRPDPEAVAILREMAPLFAEVIDVMDPSRDLLIIISPTCPPYKSSKDMSYAPIAVIGPGFGPGLLTSSSSRRTGMVSNVDIAPTILRFFGIHVPGANGRPGAPAMSGRAMAMLPARDPLRDVLAITRRGVRLVQLQYRFAPVYALGEFFAFLGVGLALTFAPASAHRSRRRLRIILLLAMSLPLALLFLGPFDPGGVVQPYIIVAALAAALTWLPWRDSAPLSAMSALLAVTAGVVVLDAVTGSHLLNNFIINFGAYGTRLYGIHNETMGFVVACAAIGGAGLAQQVRRRTWSRWSLALWFVAVTVVIGAPFWGANFGGAITAAFGFAVAYLGIRAGRPRLRHWAGAIAPAVGAGILVVAMDLLGKHTAWTHIGDSVRIVGNGGMHAAAEILARKAGLAWQVMTTIPALSITVALCLVGTWLVLKPPPRLRAALEAYPSMWAAFAGGFAGAAMGIIVNDSGLVAASSTIGITASAMAYAALDGNGASQ
jgi:hypothetical protein